MVYAEATSVLPLLTSDAYHRGHWRNRDKRRFAQLFDQVDCQPKRTDAPSP
jgi:deoxyhypusine synthase